MFYSNDYFLFPNLKKCLSEMNAYFEGLGQSYFVEGIRKLEKRWNRCIEMSCVYVQKENKLKA